MEKLEHYYEVVENCIRTLHVDPALCRSVKTGQWDLRVGSASVWIDVWKLENQEYGYLQVMAPVVKIPPVNRETFYKEILTINHQLYGVAMTLFEDYIYVKMIRELEDLSESEALAMINRIGNYADEYDDLLQRKFHPSSAPEE